MKRTANTDKSIHPIDDRPKSCRTKTAGDPVVCLIHLHDRCTLKGSEDFLIALRGHEISATSARTKVQESIGYKCRSTSHFQESWNLLFFLHQILHKAKRLLFRILSFLKHLLFTEIWYLTSKCLLDSYML